MPRYITIAVLLAVTTVLSLAVIGTRPAAGAQSGGIRSIDFRNFTYHPSCLGEEGDSNKAEAVRTKNGVYSRGDERDPDRVYFEVKDVAYGVTGDGREIAVVTTLCNTGGTGQFSDAIIFEFRAGKPVQVATVGAGDRADGGIHAVKVVNGLIKVERYGQEHSGACCPEYIDTTTLKLTGNKLTEVGKATRRPYGGDRDEIYPKNTAKPIQFERGHSSARIKGSTEADDEYSIAAKAGQTMIVNVAAPRKNATLTVLAVDGTAVDGKSDDTGWTGALPYSGKYRIIVHSTGGNAVYTLEVTIR